MMFIKNTSTEYLICVRLAVESFHANPIRIGDDYNTNSTATATAIVVDVCSVWDLSIELCDSIQIRVVKDNNVVQNH